MFYSARRKCSDIERVSDQIQNIIINYDTLSNSQIILMLSGWRDNDGEQNH